MIITLTCSQSRRRCCRWFSSVCRRYRQSGATARPVSSCIPGSCKSHCRTMISLWVSGCSLSFPARHSHQFHSQSSRAHQVQETWTGFPNVKSYCNWCQESPSVSVPRYFIFFEFDSIASTVISMYPSTVSGFCWVMSVCLAIIM